MDNFKERLNKDRIRDFVRLYYTYTNGAYDFVIAFQCKDLTRAKKLSNEWKTLFGSNLLQLDILEEIIPISVSEINNPNLDKIIRETL